jgi:hypothetical protein
MESSNNEMQGALPEAVRTLVAEELRSQLQQQNSELRLIIAVAVAQAVKRELRAAAQAGELRLEEPDELPPKLFGLPLDWLVTLSMMLLAAIFGIGYWFGHTA